MDCHPQTVAKWVDEGLPVAKRGGRGRASLYDETQVRAWLEAREQVASQTPDLLVSRARKELAQAVEAEQRVAIRAKTLVPAADVEREWIRRVAGYRARMLALPLALTEQVVRAHATGGMDAAETVMQRAIHQALDELAVGVLPAQPKKTRRTRASRTRRGMKAR